jgi:hypothetical protein
MKTYPILYTNGKKKVICTIGRKVVYDSLFGIYRTNYKNFDVLLVKETKK